MHVIAGRYLAAALAMAAAPLPAETRTWKGADGSSLEAELVEAGAGKVFLAQGGKRREFPLSAFAEEEMAYLRTWRKENRPLVTGLQPQYAAHTRAFPRVSDYFRGWEPREKAHGYFREFWKRLKRERSPEDNVALAASATRALLYVPPECDGLEAWGVYLHLSPLDEAWLPKGYEEVLARRRLLFLSPHDGGNAHDEFLRAAQALDALASVRKDYPVDPARVVVGGFSGGGYMSFWMLMVYPEHFAGAVNHGRDFPLREVDLGGQTYADSVPFLQDQQLRRIAGRGKRWAFWMGDRDPNYGHLQRCLPDWKAFGFDHRVWAVPGADHRTAPPSDLEAALRWVLREDAEAR